MAVIFSNHSKDREHCGLHHKWIGRVGAWGLLPPEESAGAEQEAEGGRAGPADGAEGAGSARGGESAGQYARWRGRRGNTLHIIRTFYIFISTVYLIFPVIFFNI